jgi:hypothetical protein|tara:strand:+ start:777 stop:1022 length:246 start_codon:yes stop_codon:yes gene_type:complete
MEYFFGPALALLISLKFTSMQKDEQRLKMQDLDERIELIEETLLQSQAKNDKREEELSRRVMETVLPVAKAVNRLNQTVGI